MASTFPQVREARSGGPLPPPNRTRPFLLLVSDSEISDLVWALQLVGVPTVMAADEAILEYWVEVCDPAVFVLESSDAWAAAVATRLVIEGKSVVMLSDHEEERLGAIREGFADALSNALSPTELATRLRAKFTKEVATKLPAEDQGPLSVDPRTRTATWRAQERPLPPKLFDLAAYLVSRPSTVISVSTLLRDVWHEGWSDENKVHQGIRRLRKQLGTDASLYIRSKRGHGYAYYPR